MGHPVNDNVAGEAAAPCSSSEAVARRYPPEWIQREIDERERSARLERRVVSGGVGLVLIALAMLFRALWL